MISDPRTLLGLLDLDPIAEDRFLGAQPSDASSHVFGGQIAAQALVAAGRTVEHKVPHSLHSYFLRAGDTGRPTEYSVRRVRDGGAFANRQVTAEQDGVVIFEAMMSFCVRRQGPDFHRPMPETTGPERLRRIEEVLEPYADEQDGWWVRPRAFDMRYVHAPPRLALDDPHPQKAENQIWMRSSSDFTSAPALNAALVTYLTDMTLLDTVMRVDRRTSRGPGKVASLDHSIWFQRPADFADWLLYDQISPGAADGRGLATGYIYNRSGDLVCIVMQEGYLGSKA
ncbi:acyl-CoA thioesterase II [Gordonia sp. HNM0687]|uniref:Acyl-CoA thioesterase II n=1 Tax=Gordonia mangrovi TaxID=2665643 RepID=A0A6L7GZB4_9ACTN|nr:acyl-CoA thioesterase domain-containing protein [Gordonia mangrovi]MXP24195.1 acyl-CoA thioesterase II [Gordonia mangrovi]UVF76913.1 thioesterase family protein [Gordonia mangrovi]